MNVCESLNHTKWECKYHVVFIPKYRRKVLFGKLRPHLGKMFRELARQKECEIKEGHLMVDHVHMLMTIPPKYAVSQVVGYLKGTFGAWTGVVQCRPCPMRGPLGDGTLCPVLGRNVRPSEANHTPESNGKNPAFGNAKGSTVQQP